MKRSTKDLILGVCLVLCLLLLVPWKKHRSQAIVFTVDRQGIVGLKGVVNSTYQNSLSKDDLQFYILTTGEDDKEVRTLFAGFPVEYVFVSEVEFNVNFKLWGEYSHIKSKVVYLRYFLHHFLPKHLKRVVYLDADIIVEKDLGHLFTLNLEGLPLAAVYLCRWGASFERQFVMKNLEQTYDPYHCSFNNGMMLYDLEMWRAHNYEDLLVDITQKNTEKHIYNLASQPPFNLVFYNNVLPLPEMYNLMDLGGLNQIQKIRGNAVEVPSTRTRAEVQNAAILHWNGVFKPWKCYGPYSEVYLKYIKPERPLVPCTGPHILTIPTHKKYFTVMIVTFNRMATLLQVLESLQQICLTIRECSEILIVANGKEECPQELLFDAVTGEPRNGIRCVPAPENMVQNRFLLWNEIRTEAVFLHDDDTLVALEDVKTAFLAWKMFPDRVIGFESRTIVNTSEGIAYKFKVDSNNRYHLIIGKLMIVHRNYLKIWSENAALVEQHMDSSAFPCEDIAMNMLIATTSGHPPVLVLSNHTEILTQNTEETGLSTSQNTNVWKSNRSRCVRELQTKFFPTYQPALFGGSLKVVGRSLFDDFLFVDSVVSGESFCSGVEGSRPCHRP
eukprot:Lithocolla_globosa_v1_NODE_2242_length_2092_cov_7.866961.p1 type:complete len:614 gc:universal NODE_2242_length_2092_cov_7.866961:32-1873(+)